MINYDIVVYGCGNDAEMFSDFFQRMKLGTIKYYVQTKKTIDEFKQKKVIEVGNIEWGSFDYIVIASSKFALEIREVLDNICPNEYREKIIYMLDFVNGIKNENDQYSVCSVEGDLNFLFNNTDTVIGPWMWLSGKLDGADVMDYIFDFIDKRSALNKNGIFLDIGANIGTASIYAKHIEPGMKVISFEPGKENFNMLRINCILNNMDDIRVENVGLGSKHQRINYVYHPENPGGSRVVEDSSSTNEIVTICKLDDFIVENKIDITNISFIWMDIEGSECDAIIGGEKTLRHHRIPMIHEFNYNLYDEGKFNQYLLIMSACYESFIDVRAAIDGDDIIHSIFELEMYAEQLDKQTDLLFF